MNSKLIGKFGGVATAALLILGTQSCVERDNEVGSSLIPLNQKYQLFTVEIPLENIQMKMVDSLSGFSNTRITIGAIRDDEFGLTTRSCAMSLVPISDTLDYGKNPKLKSFHFTAAHDTTSFADAREEYILQNVNVYELSSALDFTMADMNTPVEHKPGRITDGIPVYNGKDSLSFNFSKSFAQKYMNIKQEDLVDMDTYLAKFPGIYIDTDKPYGKGGRIDMFQLQLGVNTSYGYITKDYAELKFEAEYDGERKDTSFVFYFCPNLMYDVDSLIDNKSNSSSYQFPQYCFNSTGHESKGKEGVIKESASVEGGGGLKPVISAAEIRDALRAEISKHGDPDEAVISRATISIPFQFPEDYTTMYMYPEYLSPTVRVSYTDYVSFGSITDTSSDDEDPGEINRSTLKYAPDVTFHVQRLISSDVKKISNYDIWLLPMSTETSYEEESSSSSASDYYSMLSYMNYYNNMYGYGGYGYGSYGYGYDSYGYNSYSNYYNYYLMSQYASSLSSSSSSTSTSVELDKDRYFNAVINGPQAKDGRVPTIKVIYALPIE